MRAYTEQRDRGVPFRDFWLRWSGASVAAGSAATLLDAGLLQQRRDFFTGGFLAVDHVTGLGQAAGFVVTSLLTDVAVLAPIALIALWGCERIGIARRPAVVLSTIVGVAPVVAADFLQYRLLSYLGDAFDLALMFELSGRSPAEFLAVGSGHLVPLVLAFAAGTALLVAAGWFLRARERHARHKGASTATVLRPAAPPFFGPAAISVLVIIGAGVLSAAVRSSSDVLDNGLRRKPTGQLLGAAVVSATDFDGDGFGILGRPPDPDLFDARIEPYAVDVPGSGVDENGVAGDLPPGPDYEEELPALTPWPSRPDVVLIVLESFRADALGAELRGKRVTPVLSELARRGISVEHAYSHNGYTVQSRHHILSGSLAGFDAGTIVDDFAQNGYQTAYFSAQDDSFGGDLGLAGMTAAEVAYDARSDRARRYSTFTTAGSLAVSHGVLTERVEQFLAARDSNRPLFLYVNFHDTHYPYFHDDLEPLISSVVVRQGGIRPGAADDVREMYLNTAANVDAAVGRLIERVRGSLGREPAVIVLSDHGESLFDENFLGHGYSLNDAQTRIPLIVANLPMTVEEPFGQADLRALLRTTLAQPAGEGLPQVVRRPGKQVFQYLGVLERAAQIAFVSPAGRITYDIRDQMFSTGPGIRRSPEQLSASEREQFLRLVHTWERMIVAKHRRGRAGE